MDQLRRSPDELFIFFASIGVGILSYKISARGTAHILTKVYDRFGLWG